jgi:hypothetical protein
LRLGYWLIERDGRAADGDVHRLAFYLQADRANLIFLPDGERDAVFITGYFGR